MSAKLNCWEVQSCGREPGGHAVDEMGICPAASDPDVDGINGGINGGRICWAVAGTFCGGCVQGTLALKRQTCMSCDFFDLVLREEGDRVVMVRPGQDTWVGYRA